MKASGTRPAIGAAKDGTGAMRVADSQHVVTQEVERLLPTHGNIFVAAATVVCTGAALEPAATDRRLGNAHLVAQCGWKVVDDAVGIRITGISPDFECISSMTRREHAPMRRVRF